MLRAIHEHSVCDIRWITVLALSERLQSEMPYWFRLRDGYVWVRSSVQTCVNGRNMEWMICAGGWEKDQGMVVFES